MLSKIVSQIRKIDQIGNRVGLVHNGSSRYKTVGGGILSLAIYAFVGLGLLNFKKIIQDGLNK